MRDDEPSGGEGSAAERGTWPKEGGSLLVVFSPTRATRTEQIKRAKWTSSARKASGERRPPFTLQKMPDRRPYCTVWDSSATCNRIRLHWHTPSVSSNRVLVSSLTPPAFNRTDSLPERLFRPPLSHNRDSNRPAVIRPPGGYRHGRQTREGRGEREQVLDVRLAGRVLRRCGGEGGEERGGGESCRVDEEVDA